MPEPVRCAIYTRKSSDEGLEQEFNSLHAQREACEAYVLSQKHEGWQLLPDAYDDGGVSGGTLDRPGLKALLAQVEAGRVDTIVVYKVDRLTRSLADFAKLVELFDKKSVSFVSVTQAFNTTTSMGRLTLNVLLSFAQFEREVTGERIRDKIAASKAKGMWMGGRPPLGYDPKDRSLVVNEAEAAQVRTLFSAYLELKTVDALVSFADKRGIVSKRWTGGNGQELGGMMLLRGALYHILANPVYIGEISHRGKRHPGLHQPIVDAKLFAKVQALLAENRRRRKLGKQAAETSLLAGLVFDRAGERLTPTHTSRNGRRYRYYASNALRLRIPATLLEQVVIGTLTKQVSSPEIMAPLLVPDGGSLHDLLALHGERAAQLLGDKPRAALLDLVERVVIGVDQVAITLKPLANEGAIKLSTAANFTRRNRHLSVVGVSTIQKTSPSVLAMFAKGRIWFEELAAGTYPSIDALAKAEGVTGSYVGRLMNLAFADAAIVDDVFEGRLLLSDTAPELKDKLPLPCAWEAQRAAIS
ncbi:recombinase family protein [Sphingomonas sp.]|uniref:recombinase family protein n=1 Tax=Sphingomonas sp. TaxID=28214 RepID=UPI002DF16243|nr:recombinase family protein [Sphingomonas sp.]